MREAATPEAHPHAHAHVGERRGVSEHRARLAELLAPLAARPAEEWPLRDALGTALAADLVAPMSLPPFDNSQMDGFAVCSADFSGGLDGAPGHLGPGLQEFRVAAAIPAGTVPRRLTSGHAAPIMTGAVMPAGADAVVPVERAVPSGFPEEGGTVALPPVGAGTYVRPAASDVEAGAVVLRSGTPLGAPQIGLAAGLGLETVPVRPPLRVVLVSTGAELAPPGVPLRPGQIYDANGTLLGAALREAGLVAVNVVVRSDKPSELRNELEALASLGENHRPDLVVTTGGVSKGAFEATKLALEGHEVEFVHLAMQPGGPQGLGSFSGVPIVAFPGNPVSCWVSWEVLLRPVLAGLLGAPTARRRVRAALAEPLESPAGKLQVRRARLRADGVVELVGGPDSHLLGALAASDALVMVPEDAARLPAGADVEVWLL
ncbi:molybdopterin molybdotransferase MoeA [Sinomonas notoginsengisoli]|uniref:molybdopterin molybdotransferase MoeA n=1 Tax=Sinomonas notoginsengisoli TaxID=1457311 RepID=UPI001F2953D6|nr:gephyrin-like molybdotransferase Glp [Sinomonas notoginsengisoli]